MGNLIAFDIETGPLPDLPPFDPSTVKRGNLGDEKFAEKVAVAEKKWVDEAALDATRGQVLAIGWQEDRELPGVAVGKNRDERSLLAWFWKAVTDAGLETRFAGHYSNSFDLPFLRRRSLICGVDVPEHVIDPRGYWHHSFVDLLDVWRSGERQLHIKLDALAAAFGVETKLEGVTGADFARLWRSDDPEEHRKAVAYLEQDVSVTMQLAVAMGL